MSFRVAVSSCAAVGVALYCLPRASAKEPSQKSQRVWMTGRKRAIPNGSLVDLDRPTPIPWFSETSDRWERIVTGPNFGAALTGDGRLFVWSWDQQNQRHIPPQVVSGITGGVSDIVTSENKIIILTKSGKAILVSETGSVVGELEAKSGNRSWPGSSSVPFVAVSAGRHHIALIDKRGRVWTAGSNGSGQCGRVLSNDEKGNRFAYYMDEKPVEAPVDFVTSLRCIFDAQREKAVSVACGGAHTVFVTETGKAFSFGDDSKIQLGLGDTRSQDVPDYVPHSGMGRLDPDGASPDMSKLFSQTMPAVKYTFYDRHVRSKVTEMKLPSSEAMPSKVIAGGEFTILAVGSEGQMVCCGENQLGQCGRGLNKQQQTFAPVKLSKRVKPVQVSCGTAHCVASLEDGSVYAWGANKNGQLGCGNRSPQSPPVPMHGSKIRGPLVQDIITRVGLNDGSTKEELEAFFSERQRDAVPLDRLLGSNKTLPAPPNEPVDKTKQSRLKENLLHAIDESRESLMMSESEQQTWKPIMVTASFDNSVIVMTKTDSK